MMKAPTMRIGVVHVSLEQLIGQQADELRQRAAKAAYDAAFADLSSQTNPRRTAQVYGICAVACALALVSEQHHDSAAKRIAHFPEFASFDGRRGVSALAWSFNQRLTTVWFDACRRREVLKGLAVGFAEMAYQLVAAATIHHVPASAPIRAEGFPPFIDYLVFGISKRVHRQSLNEAASGESDLTIAAVESVPAAPLISDLLDDWLKRQPSDASSQSRYRSSAVLFIKSVGCMPEDLASVLANIDGATAASAFDVLARSLGTKWGTATKLQAFTGEQLLAAANADPRPKWASTPLTDAGLRSSCSRVQDFVNYVRDAGISVPAIDWNALSNDQSKQDC